MSVGGERFETSDLPATDEELDELVRGFLAVQARTAIEQARPLRRGTHAKGVCARAVFEVLDVAAGPDPAVAARLSMGLYGKPGSYPATVRFANSDPSVESDWVPDVRGFSFAIEFAAAGAGGPVARQDYSLQSASTLPFNDVRAFVAFATVTGAANEATALGSLPFRDQLKYAETARAVIEQKRQLVRPYQKLRYWSNVPFRHGARDIVKYSTSPAAANAAHPLGRGNPDALRDELIRHLECDATMSSFDFALQFLNVTDMTYQGKRRDPAFWIENASVEWPEAQAPFHTVARLTLLPRSPLSAAQCEAMYIDVNRNSTAWSTPVGGVNRARACAEAASRKARRASASVPIAGLPSRAGERETVAGVRKESVEPEANSATVVDLADTMLAAPRPAGGELEPDVLPVPDVAPPGCAAISGLPAFGVPRDPSPGRSEDIAHGPPALDGLPGGLSTAVAGDFFDGPAQVLSTPGPIMPGGLARSMFSLINEDDETVQILFLSTALLETGGASIPAACVTFDPDFLTLGRGEEGDVSVCVAVPPSTRSGTYCGVIRASPLDHLHPVLVVRVETA